MKPTKQGFASLLLLLALNSFGQKSSKIGYYFDNPILVDSSSTLIIPTKYSSSLFSSNKLMMWGDYYANIIFYNFQTDTDKKLFEKDTYIVGFNPNRYSFYEARQPKLNKTSKWMLFQVKNVDYNANGRIDEKDPTILYASDLFGNNLKQLTTEKESVSSIDFFEKQNFALIKIQRDSNKNKDFDSEDTDFYYTKLDLNTLTFGKMIETR